MNWKEVGMYLLSFFISPCTEEIGRVRHVPISLDGKLLTKLFEGYQVLKSIHKIKLEFFTYFRCFVPN
jgi:hypothetical protein